MVSRRATTSSFLLNDRLSIDLRLRAAGIQCLESLEMVILLAFELCTPDDNFSILELLSVLFIRVHLLNHNLERFCAGVLLRILLLRRRQLDTRRIKQVVEAHALASAWLLGNGDFSLAHINDFLI